MGQAGQGLTWDHGSSRASTWWRGQVFKVSSPCWMHKQLSCGGGRWWGKLCGFESAIASVIFLSFSWVIMEQQTLFIVGFCAIVGRGWRTVWEKCHLAGTTFHGWFRQHTQQQILVLSLPSSLLQESRPCHIVASGPRHALWLEQLPHVTGFLSHWRTSF